MPTVNSRKTNEMFDTLQEAMERAARIIERDGAFDGLIVSSVEIRRNARNNYRGDHVVRYFLEINSHD